MAVKRRFSLAVFVLVATPCIAQPKMNHTATARITWASHKGVKTFSLQIANDEQFQDVLSDRLVDGSEYLVTDLSPGKYFWRVARVVSNDSTVAGVRALEVAKLPAKSSP